MTNNSMSTATQSTWMNARQEFGAAVTTALAELLQQGFSRERATAVLLRQITGGHDKPNDEQVFAFMEKHGLGNQQALLALTLSTVLKNRFSKGRAEMEQGLRAITSIVQQIPRQPSIAEAKDESAVGMSTESSSNISLPLKFSSDKTQSKVVNGDWKGIMTHKAKSTTRKRALETTTSSEDEPVVENKRLRANSVSEEVTAKVEEAASAVVAATRAVAPDAKVKSSPAVARNKRSRSVEEVEVVHPVVALGSGKRRKSSM